MSDFIIRYEAGIRVGFFIGVLLLMAVWEIRRPRRRLLMNKASRWLNNLLLVAFNSFVLRLLFPAAAAGLAIFVQAHGWGLLNFYQIPFVPAFLVTLLLMDFVVWLQHVMTHAIPMLWRLHRVHHADPDIDVTTGSRFHPVEIILSMLIKFATIAVLGPPVVAVIVFEIVLNATAMFNHSNIHLPDQVDKWLRWFIVTPDMHRIHHSVEDDEANSNFGFNLSIWDRVMGTYRQDPRAGHIDMKIGIDGFNDEKTVCRLPGMLSLPLKGTISQYAINTRRWEKPDHRERSKPS